MSKHSALLGSNPEWGSWSVFHRLHDGDWAVETLQHTDPILDLNKEKQNATPHHFAGMRQVASIPNVVIVKWMNDYGFDFYNREHRKSGFLHRLLNSSDWKWLRTDSSYLTPRN